MVSESLAGPDPLSLDPCLAWRVFMSVSMSSGSFCADPSICAMSLRDDTEILWIRTVLPCSRVVQIRPKVLGA